MLPYKRLRVFAICLVSLAGGCKTVSKYSSPLAQDIGEGRLADAKARIASTDPALLPNALYIAARDNRLELVQILLKQGVKPNAATQMTKDYTALAAAADGGHVDVVRELLDNGADPNYLAKPNGIPAVFAAGGSCHVPVLELLVARGADLNLAPPGRIPTLAIAAMKGDVKCVKFFISKGADADLAVAKLEYYVAENESRAATGRCPSCAGGLSQLRSAISRIKDHAQRESVGLSAGGQGSLSKSELSELVQAAVAGATQAQKKPAAQAGPVSDVDAPAYRHAQRPDDYALVVGIQDYSDLPPAPYAQRDAEAVRDHLLAMGLPSRNVVFLAGEKAGYKGIEKFVETWLPRNINERSRVFFYFSGHGAPEVKTGEAYLIPWDGDPAFLENTGYPLNRLYAQLGGLKAGAVIAVLDACFSGAGGRSVLARGARPLVTEVNVGAVPKGRLTVFAATSGQQITTVLDHQGHGTFTYHFLKGLSGGAREATGAVTAAGLHKYLGPAVEDAARRQNRDQSPVLIGSDPGLELTRF